MNGILPLWKERGMTSHDCVYKLRKILQTKKIGHGGTLDPDVDGVLPICIGRGTKVIEYLQDSGKVYVGEITLGYSTTTEDVSGETVAVSPVRTELELSVIDSAMSQMVGTITQIPPMYSAVRVEGKRLYEYAREGLEVERPQRKAEITYFKRTTPPVFNEEAGTLSWKFEVGCGKGTYVRTLAVDTGKILGYEAHMSDLTRVGSGGYSAKDCLTLQQVALLMEADDLSFLQPIETAVAMFESIEVTPQEYQKIFKNGGFVPVADYQLQDDTGLIAILCEGQLISIYQKHPNKPQFLKPVKVLRND